MFVVHNKVPKNKLIMVYCKKGVRAGLAKNILRMLGYRNVISLGGVDTEPLRSQLSKVVEYC